MPGARMQVAPVPQTVGKALPFLMSGLRRDCTESHFAALPNSWQFRVGAHRRMQMVAPVQLFRSYKAVLCR